MNAFKFNGVLYKGNINTDFYFYCLHRNKKLIKYLFINLFFIVISLFFKKSIYIKNKYKNLKDVKNIDVELNNFIKNNKKVVPNNYKKIDLIVDRVPVIFIRKIFKKEKILGYELNSKFEVNNADIDNKISNIKNCNNLFTSDRLNLDRIKANNVIYLKPLKFSLNLSLNTLNILICFILSFIITCVSFLYNNTVLDINFIKSFFSPLLFLLNFLPIFFLMLLLLFITKRISFSWLITLFIIIIHGVANQSVLTYRDDVVKFGDLFLAKEALIMTNRYDLVIKWYTIVIIILCIINFFILKKYIDKINLNRCKRTITILLILVLSIFMYFKVYSNQDIYQSVGDKSLINIWLSTRQSQIRGLTYPFIYSIRDSMIKKPDNYDEKKAKKVLNEFAYKDISNDKKVNIIAIMLEAYNDFSKFNKINFNTDVYEKFHNIQKDSLYGNIVTNIFGGGTIITERNFLTGYDTFPSFRKNTNSYVWYFKEQGYNVEAFHPSYGAFYNRSLVNINLGFNYYYNYDNTFKKYDDDFGKDELFMNYIIKKYEENKKTNKPYFSFSVTYQNHGPYTGENYDGKQFFFDNDGRYNSEAYNVINEYLKGIYSTNDALDKLVNYFDNENDATIIIFFGDHNPFIGENGYSELGINMDLDNVEGFLNYYETPYVIHANKSARKMFNKSFVGEGNNISPIFLMNELFDYIGLEGNEYLQYMSNLKEKIDVINDYYYKEDKIFVKNDNINKKLEEYKLVNYYVSNNFNKERLG